MFVYALVGARMSRLLTRGRRGSGPFRGGGPYRGFSTPCRGGVAGRERALTLCPNVVLVDDGAGLNSSIGDLCCNSELSDVELLVAGEVIPAHKLILSSRSPYFR